MHTIITRDVTEITRKIYMQQKTQPTSGDFCQLVAKDCEMIGLHMSEEHVAQHTRKQFKQLVKCKVKEAAYAYLMADKGSKMEGLNYTKLEMQKYLRHKLFTQENASLLMSLRTRSVRGIRTDFGDMYSDKGCPLPGCPQTKDSLQHVLDCSVLASEMTTRQLHHYTGSYSEVFSEDVMRQKEVTMAFSQLLEIREELLESESAAEMPTPCIYLQSHVL